MAVPLPTSAQRPWHLDFWGLATEPFRPTLRWPQERGSLFPNRAWQEALARLHYVSEYQFGLAILAGPSGTGKSLLLRAAADELALQNLRPLIHACQPGTNSGAYPLGIPSSEETRQIFQVCLDGHSSILTEDRYVLMLDDVQRVWSQRDVLHRLIDRALEQRQLGCLVLTVPLTQGAEVFEEFASLAPLLIRLPPLAEWEVADYLQHRFEWAGGQGQPFTEECSTQMHRFTQGIPRLLNRLAHECLLMAALREQREISEMLVAETHRGTLAITLNSSDPSIIRAA